MIDKYYYEYAIDEIVEMIKTNILLYYRNWDKKYLDLKKYCDDKEDVKYEKIDYWNLVHFVEEVLAELINCEYLYDFRALE